LSDSRFDASLTVFYVMVLKVCSEFVKQFRGSIDGDYDLIPERVKTLNFIRRGIVADTRAKARDYEVRNNVTACISL